MLNQTVENSKNEKINLGSEQYLAVIFILRADQVRHGSLIREVENQYLQGTNNYPSTVTDAYNLRTNWKPNPKDVTFCITSSLDFTNIGNAKSNSRKQQERKDKFGIICYDCQDYGNYVHECPNRTKNKLNDSSTIKTNESSENRTSTNGSGTQFLTQGKNATNQEIFCQYNEDQDQFQFFLTPQHYPQIALV
jgi:hypothetical protein